MEETTTQPTTLTAPVDTGEPRADRPVVRRTPTVRPRTPRGVALTDPVGDMLTRIRNAVGAHHESVAIPSSRIKVAIAKILKNEGFIGGYSVDAPIDRAKAKPEGPAPAAGQQLVVRLKYIGGKTPTVTGVRRISKPGLRVYARKTEMPRVLGGLGVAIVSTSSGLMTGREAERKGLGGEVLAYVW